MAVKGPCPLPYTLVAASDLSAHQFGAVALDSNGKVALANIGSDLFLGTLENKPESGRHAKIEFGPCVTKARAGAAVTVGNYITVQSGWFIAANKLLYTNAVTGNVQNLGSKTAIVGLCLETVASGAIFTAKLFEHVTTINS